MLFTLVVVIAAAGVGTWSLKWVSFTNAIEAAALRLLFGLCLCATIALVIGSRGLGAAQFVVMGLAVAATIYEIRLAARGKGIRLSPLLIAKPVARFECVCLASISVALFLAFLSTCAPATSWDAGVAHLALPQDYARDGSIHVIEGNAYSAYPHLMHSLFAVAFLGGNEYAAMHVNWLFALVACILMLRLGTRLDSRSVGLAAAAILATSPIFTDQAGTASIDLAFTTLVLASMYCLCAWRQEERFPWLILAGLFAGFSCGVRHTGYLVCVLLAIGVLVLARSNRISRVIAFGACVLVAAAPWMLRSHLTVGNPFYPFFMQQFGSQAVPDFEITSIGTHESVLSTSLSRFLLFPWLVVMKPMLYDGWSKSPGPFVLTLGLPGLLIGGRAAWALGSFSIVGGICMFFFRQYARYFLPFFAPMMLVAAMTTTRLPALRRLSQVLLLLGFVYGLALAFGAVYFKIPVALGIETRDEYLERRVERYPAFEWVNKYLDTDRHVVLSQDIRTFYFSGPSYQNYLALTPLIAISPDQQMAWLRDRDIKYWFYPEAFVKRTPAFGRLGLLSLFNSWRSDPAHFKLLHVIDTASPHALAKDRVEIYEIQYGETTPSG